MKDEKRERGKENKKEGMKEKKVVKRENDRRKVLEKGIGREDEKRAKNGKEKS